MKKVLLIGASGTIGRAIAAELSVDCKVVGVSLSSEPTVDLAFSESIKSLYLEHRDVDAVICAAARGVAFSPLDKLCREDMLASMHIKLLGQVDCVLLGMRLLGPQVSYTLTTGLLNVDPIANGAVAAMINNAVEGFVTAAALDVPKQQRINCVSPALVEESLNHYVGLFPPGYPTVQAAEVALAYRRSVMSVVTGRVFRIGHN